MNSGGGDGDVDGRIEWHVVVSCELVAITTTITTITTATAVPLLLPPSMFVYARANMNEHERDTKLTCRSGAEVALLASLP